MEFWQDYGLFLMKTVTLSAAFVVLALFLTALSVRGRERSRERLEVRRLNDRYHNMEMAIQQELLGGKKLRQFAKLRAKQHKEEQAKDAKRRIFVLNFVGDIRASQVENLRQEVSALLTLAGKDDEVVVRVETGGGVMHGYGLAASQLVRIRERGIPLTVTVDKVAASGGYMLACVADRILAAPFAIVGSIGVIGQVPNFHRLLQRHDVDFEQHTAGQYKRTLTMFGENTDERRAKFVEELEDAHTLFKDFIRQHRPQLELDKVATGEHWFGERALSLGLVDELKTSDDYLLAASKDATLLELSFKHKEKLGKRLSIAFESAIAKLMQR
ncbi:protease SohB [Alkalilimnicola ehrlichii]|uniref:Protease SohB n=1 Tax=Alkalilimnicola ehrlichii TaxID=351052 RepID=A0A3E0X216_9GAMM|nr:protease SohB [Alkalilimnicola ehrlichii]RFA31190.1 protease SohB [Alkalilimnicola ehrlichii]RFA39527.1 protease SohB [Alkalilimnicola ehrlichii]